MTETELATRDHLRDEKADAYFRARPKLDSTANRRLFEAGFERAWGTAPAVGQAALTHIRAKCEKCGGEGWVWSHELDEADEATRADTMTHYACDGAMCVLARELAELYRAPNA